MEMYYCPNCGSDQVYSSHIQGFMVNTQDHYCHLVKTHDDDSPSGCRDCHWKGQREELTVVEEKK